MLLINWTVFLIYMIYMVYHKKTMYFILYLLMFEQEPITRRSV